MGYPNCIVLSHNMKLVLIGELGVGKTALVRRFVDSPDDKFPKERRLKWEKSIIVRGNSTLLSIWDTAGQERHRSLTASYYRGAHGCLILFDVTKKDTFDNVNTWYNDLQYHMQPEISTILVGTNCKSENRQIPNERAEQLATERGIPYIEVSVEDGTNVNEVFEQLADMVIENCNKNPSLNLTNRRTSLSSSKSKDNCSSCSCF